MTKPDKQPEPPRLLGIRFREALTLSGVTSLNAIDLVDRHAQFEVLVSGPQVYIRAPGEPVREIPRAACVLVWEHTGPLEELARAAGGKR